MTKYLLLISIVALILCDSAGAAVRPVWIDADPSCGLGMTDDVDDCWAIITAVRSSELKVVGISTVFGNVPIEQTTATARTLLDAIAFHEPGRAMAPLYAGSSKPFRRVAGISPAVMELAAALTKSPLTILALGPLTNIALLLQHHPELKRQIVAVVAVAGQRPGQIFHVGNTPILHFHDMNVRKDADAFDLVLRSGVPLHLIPFEVGRQVVVTATDLRALEGRGGLDAWLAVRSLAWLALWKNVLGAPGFSGGVPLLVEN